MLVKVLIENTSSEGLCAEHGLCLYVEYINKKYLIDSGASNLFASNAKTMNVDLSQIDKAFLSHAHYDHSGGYEEFFRVNNQAKVYLQSSSRYKHYFKIAGPIKKDIGILGDILNKYQDRFVYIDGASNIDEGIYIVPHSTPGLKERARRTHMCTFIDNKIQYDDFSHEQTIVFEEEDGLVCFNSCSHSGVDIVINEVKKAFPNKNIKAYFGGFHMMGITGISSCSYSKQEVQDVANELKESSEATFYSGHCTGTIAFEWLKEILGDRLVAIQSGTTIINNIQI